MANKYVEYKIISSLDKYFSDGEPTLVENSKTAFRNEEVNFQLAFKNINRYSVHDCKIVINSEYAKYVKMYFVKNANTTYVTVNGTDDYYLSKNSGVYPDILQPIEDNTIYLIGEKWVTVFVSVKLPTDKYVEKADFNFVLQDSKGEELASLDYSISYVNEMLERNNLVLTNWFHVDGITGFHGVEPYTKKFYQIFDSYLDLFVECYNTILTPVFTPALDTGVGVRRKNVQLVDITQTEKGYKFSFTKLKKFIDFCKSKGIVNFELSHLFSQWGGKYCPAIYIKKNGKLEHAFGWDVLSDSEEYLAFLDAFLPQLVKFIYKNKLQNNVFFHLTDEPDNNTLPLYEKLSGIVKKYIGNMPIIDALSSYDFYEKKLVDIPVVVINSAKKFLDNKVDNFLVYTCCDPVADYYTNRFMNMPSQRLRILGIQMYLNGVQGYLHWGFNFYNANLSKWTINPFVTADADGFFPAGDSFIVYPYKDGAMPSIRHKTFKECISDYEALKVLEKYIGREKVCEFIKSEGVELFTEYPRSAVWHTEFRNKLNAYVQSFVK